MIMSSPLKVAIAIDPRKDTEAATESTKTIGGSFDKYVQSVRVSRTIQPSVVRTIGYPSL